MFLDIICVIVFIVVICIEFYSIFRMLFFFYILLNGICKYFNKIVILLYEVLVIYFIMVVIIFFVSRKKKLNFINISILFNFVNFFYGCIMLSLLVSLRFMGLCFNWIVEMKNKIKMGLLYNLIK